MLKNEEVLRVIIGLSVVVTSLALASHFAEKRERERHAKYIECLATGVKPILCSFQSVFGE